MPQKKFTIMLACRREEGMFCTSVSHVTLLLYMIALCTVYSLTCSVR